MMSNLKILLLPIALKWSFQIRIFFPKLTVQYLFLFSVVISHPLPSFFRTGKLGYEGK